MTDRKPEKRIYFVQNPVPRMKNDGVEAGDLFVAIKHGETQYSPTTVYTQAHADALNEKQGITKAMACAAEMCAMFDNWRVFERNAMRLSDLA